MRIATLASFAGAGILPCVLAISGHAQEHQLIAGQAVTKTLPTECSGSSLVDNVLALCELIMGKQCGAQSGHCKTYTRQVFTGTRLGKGTTGPGAQWNGMGGSGELMADALICSLRELSPQLRGAIRTPPLSIGLPIGKVTVVQEIGFKEFRRTDPEFKGYRKIILTLPVVGKAEAIAQSLTVHKRTYSMASPPALAGNRPITHMYALNIATDDKERTLAIKAPSFPVPTPIGAFSVTPEFSYVTRTSVIASPYAAPHLDLPDFLGSKNTVRFSDLFGSNAGVAATTKKVFYGNMGQNRTG